MELQNRNESLFVGSNLFCCHMLCTFNSLITKLLSINNIWNTIIQIQIYLLVSCSFVSLIIYVIILCFSLSSCVNHINTPSTFIVVYFITWILSSSLLLACSSFFCRLSSSRACCCSFCSHLMYSTEAFRIVPLFQRMSLQKEGMLKITFHTEPPDVGRISSAIKKKMGKSFKVFPSFMIWIRNGKLHWGIIHPWTLHGDGEWEF